MVLAGVEKVHHMVPPVVRRTEVGDCVKVHHTAPEEDTDCGRALHTVAVVVEDILDSAVVVGILAVAAEADNLVAVAEGILNYAVGIGLGEGMLAAGHTLVGRQEAGQGEHRSPVAADSLADDGGLAVVADTPL